MSALTERLPDDKCCRMQALAHSRGTSVNRLIDEMATLMLAEFGAETLKGKAERDLERLEKAAGG